MRGQAATAEQAEARAVELQAAWNSAAKDRETKEATQGSGDGGGGTSTMLPARGARAGFCAQLGAFLKRRAVLRYTRSYSLVVDLLAFMLDGFVITVIFGSAPLLVDARGIEYAQNCPRGAEWKCFQPVRNQIGPFGFYMTMSLGIAAASISTRSFSIRRHAPARHGRG